MIILTFEEYQEHSQVCALCDVVKEHRSIKRAGCALCYGFYIDDFIFHNRTGVDE